MIEKLGLKKTQYFTNKKEEAMSFTYNEIEDEVKKLQKEIEASILVEVLDEEWLPF